MADPPITDHVFRSKGYASQGKQGVGRVDPGMCSHLGSCNKPQEDHITVPDFRQQRGEK